MPTYEYRCKDCGDELEVVQSFTDDALDTCPSCGGDLRKKFAAPGISFRGSGFYKTDSRGSTTTTSNGSSGGDSDSKPSTSTSSDGGSKGSSDSGSGSSSGSGTGAGSSSSNGSNGSNGSSGSGSGSSSGSKAATPA